ncbi:MAG: adenylate/guanylate cyclase domain-containing protein [Bryobacteraceae bacterium]
MSERSFLIHRPDGASQAVEITAALTRIGRAPDNEIILVDPSLSVSRFHAEVAVDAAGNVRLTDLGSSNGTFVNDKRVNGATALGPNDVIRIGKFRLVLQVAAKPAEPESALRDLDIEMSRVDLGELQNRPNALRAPGEPETASAELPVLELLHEVGMRLARTVTVQDVIETAVDLLFQFEGAHRATLVQWDDERQAFRTGDLYGRGRRKLAVSGAADPSALILSKTILEKVRGSNRPLHIRDARSEAAFSGSESIFHAGIRAAFCSPLSYQGRFLGVLYADNLMGANAFSEADFRVFAMIAAQAGMALASATARAELLAREVELAAMRLYLPPQVAEMIALRNGDVELGGVLQPVTVVFADVRNFTQLSESLDAREVVRLLNELFTALTEVIFDAGGTVDKYIGDCVMALFGAPVPAADDLARALTAAENMQRAVSRLDPRIRIGVGLHAGQAVVGNIGSAQRMQYTAIGDTVNVAARLVSLAAPGQILVSEDVRNAAAGSFERLGEFELKGRQRKLAAYALAWSLA